MERLASVVAPSWNFIVRSFFRWNRLIYNKSRFLLYPIKHLRLKKKKKIIFIQCI